jgi:hypothetical protein
MLGPFDHYSNALLAACKKILTKPNATAGRSDVLGFKTRWRVSSEYCAWVYYTPDHKYVVSKLTDQSTADALHRIKGCSLPSEVEDQRHPPDSIKYIFALHNHPYGSTLSSYDIEAIVSAGARHGFEAETKDGAIQLSIVAFFSNQLTTPSCDGFHQYIPSTRQILRWDRAPSGWTCEQTGLVLWNEDSTEFLIDEEKAPCFKEKTP